MHNTSFNVFLTTFNTHKQTCSHTQTFCVCVSVFVIFKDSLPNRHSCLNLYLCKLKFNQSISLSLSLSLSHTHTYKGVLVWVCWFTLLISDLLLYTPTATVFLNRSGTSSVSFIIITVIVIWVQNKRRQIHPMLYMHISHWSMMTT